MMTSVRTSLLSVFLQVLLVTLQPHQANSQETNIYGIDTYVPKTLSNSIEDVGRAVDADNDEAVTLDELVAWLRSSQDDQDIATDPDKDCLTQEEWLTALEGEDFTADFANDYFDIFKAEQPVANSTAGACSGIELPNLVADAGSNTSSGNVTVASYPRSLADFLESFLRELTTFCEVDVDNDPTNDIDAYSSNDDCASLPEACALQPFLCTVTCLEYTFETTQGRTTGAFSSRVSLLDQAEDTDNFAENLEDMFAYAGGDDVFTVDEQIQDYQNNYDRNGDGCVDEAEFIARSSLMVCGGFGISEPLAEARFEDLADLDPAATCQGINVTDPGAEMTKTDFVETNTQALIDLCESDSTLYETLKECQDLSLICEVETLTKDTQACQTYLGGDPVESTAVKFYNFLQKWGEPYDAFFGDLKK